MLHLRWTVLIVALVAIVSIAAGVEVRANAQEPNSPIGRFATSSPTEISPAVVVPGGPGFFSQSSFSLRPISAGDQWSFYGQEMYNPGGSNANFTSPVLLPNGVTVKKVVFYYYDNSPTHDMIAYLVRLPLDAPLTSEEPMVEARSADAMSGIQYLEVTSITNPTIDLQSYSYLVNVILPPDTNVGFLSYRIDYQYPGYLPTVMKNSN